MAERAEAEGLAQAALAGASAAFETPQAARQAAEQQATAAADALRAAEARLSEARQQASAAQAEAERLRARQDKAIHNSLRMAAPIWTILGLPLSSSRAQKWLTSGLWCMALMAGKYRALRRRARPSLDKCGRPCTLGEFFLPVTCGRGRAKSENVGP